MLNYIRFSTRKGENKTLIEIRTAKDCRLDAVIESVSYPFFECVFTDRRAWRRVASADCRFTYGKLERGLYAVRCYT